jgi:hypothetical protein
MPTFWHQGMSVDTLAVILCKFFVHIEMSNEPAHFPTPPGMDKCYQAQKHEYEPSPGVQHIARAANHDGWQWRK